jgi:hypothetical protein
MINQRLQFRTFGGEWGFVVERGRQDLIRRDDELERWTRVGFERGTRSRNGER